MCGPIPISSALRRALLSVLGALCCLAACSPSKPADDAPPADASADAAALPEAARARQQNYADSLGEARQFIQRENLSAAARIVDAGLRKTKEDGRDWELYYAEFQLLSANLQRAAFAPLESLRRYADAMAIFRVHDHSAGQFEVLLELAVLEEDRGDFAAAERQLDEAATHLPRIDAPRLLARYDVCRGRVEAGRMNHAQALQHFAEADKRYAKAKEKLAQADTLFLAASSHDAQTDTRRARVALEKAAALYGEENFAPGVVRATHRLAILAERDKQYKKAKALLTKTRQLYLELGKHSDAAKVEQHIHVLPE
ncbi:MAG: hypothetical protein M0R76_07845 [Proteobacteria bacterium]|nr:hypothetical protein [Pseudomonadota bacterium]